MLQRVVLGQVRFNLPGVAADARGVVTGKQLAVRFAAIDRLVTFLRVLSAEQSLDDLSSGLRIMYARGGAGTREAIVILPAVSPGIGDVVAHAARVAGGQTFTGTGKHMVLYRDARAPLGYDVTGPLESAGDVILYGAEQAVPYKVENELALDKLLLRLSLVRVHGPAAVRREGPMLIVARRGLGAVVAGYLHRAAGTSALRASAALCEAETSSAFSPGAAFWLFRVEQAPKRIEDLVARTPGLEIYVPTTDGVAVAAGYRHPIHLESCRRSFSVDRLTLFGPRGVTEISPAPVLAALEDVVRIRVPAPLAAEPTSAKVSPAVLPELAVSLRLEASGQPAGHPVAALVPWRLAPWLQRLCYALPPTVLRAHRVALLDIGILLRATTALEGIPFGTLLEAAAPDVLVPLGTRLRPAVSPDLVAERLGATGGAVVVYPSRSDRPVRVSPEALSPLEPRLLAALDPRPGVVRDTGGGEPPDEPIEIENRPLGPMPLWGLHR
jgi:hypothetical protein